MSGSTFFRPSVGWVGDVIPLERDGEFLLFYLHDARTVPKPGMPWRLVSTVDFVHFVDRGEVLPSGGPEAEDFNVYTGSVVDANGTLHLFFTAQNPDRVGDDGRPLQLIGHATSAGDPTVWVTHPELTFGAPAGYESGDWRDPFVLFDGQKWRMLVAARHSDGTERRSGVVAQLTSDDLEAWTPVEPFWDPKRYVTQECPDLFRWGEWWYLVYSEFSDSFATRYRMARTLDGPWTAPESDAIDARAFYAAKTVGRDGRRFVVGWIATRESESDDGAWQWAGTMSVLEADQRPDGTLGFRLPDEVVASFDAPLESGLRVPLSLAARDRHGSVMGGLDLPEVFLVDAEIDIAESTHGVGLLLRGSTDGDAAAIVRLEPMRNRIVFDRWPRRRTGDEQWEFSGDVPFEHERPVRLEPGRHRLRVLVDHDIVLCVVDECVVLSTRYYARSGARLGFFVTDGEAALVSLRVGTPS